MNVITSVLNKDVRNSFTDSIDLILKAAEGHSEERSAQISILNSAFITLLSRSIPADMSKKEVETWLNELFDITKTKSIELIMKVTFEGEKK